jgi:hypothetical protein
MVASKTRLPRRHRKQPGVIFASSFLTMLVTASRASSREA